MKLLPILILSALVSACWPTSISFKDKGSMPEEWQEFSVKTLDNQAPNAPISYAIQLSEDIKDGIQNKTRLRLNPKSQSGEVQIEGLISSYQVNPIAIQGPDEAAKNRLTIATSYTILITKPEEKEMKLTSTRFADYDSNQDLASVEAALIEEINQQIVQDIINKLLSNW
ncbi:MAG: hypothetical protein EP338_09610 [Bacteroidetes bacterium]|nr:MAG: hypothetical protein EP338_09610 [Bacteroidota bacterium]